MDFYERLLQATHAERSRLYSIPLIEDALVGRIARTTYIAFLTEAYHHVKHTVPLLMACGSRLPARLAWLRDALIEYIEEERGHEEWVLDDIRACSADAEAVRHAGPAVATELMVAYAYHTIERLNPVGFFGMVLVLEGTSTALATRAATAIQQALRLPETAFTYLSSHGQLDLHHVEFYRGLMNRLDATDDQAAVVHASRVFYRLYADVFRQLPHAALREEVA